MTDQQFPADRSAPLRAKLRRKLSIMRSDSGRRAIWYSVSLLTDTLRNRISFPAAWTELPTR